MQPHAAASAFQVAHLDTALRYYVEVLGFTEDFRKNLMDQIGSVKSGLRRPIQQARYIAPAPEATEEQAIEIAAD